MLGAENSSDGDQVQEHKNKVQLEWTQIFLGQPLVCVHVLNARVWHIAPNLVQIPSPFSVLDCCVRLASP